MREMLDLLAKPWSSLGFISFAAAHNPGAGEALWALGGLVQGLVSKPGVHAVSLRGCWGSAGLGWPKSVVLPAQAVSRWPSDAAARHRAQAQHGAGQDNEPLTAWELHGMPFSVSPWSCSAVGKCAFPGRR